MVAGAAVLVLVHRLLAPPRVRDRRRAGRAARVAVLMVIGLLYGAATPQAFADDTPWGVPTSGDYCRFAPTPETTGSGVTGLLDPQADLPMDGTVYGDRGYAGMFWFAYDPGCTSATASTLLDQTGSTAFDSSGASADTQFGNILLKGAKLQLAGATGMRARALDQDYFTGMDSIVATGVDAIGRLLITPWIGLPMVLLGLVLLGLARRGQASESAQRVGVAMAGLLIIAFLGTFPLAAANTADRKIVELQQQFDQGFLSKLPDAVTPSVSYCQYDLTQFDKPPEWDDSGNQIIAGTACTITYRPTLDTADQFTPGEDGIVRNYTPTYFDDFYFPEVMVENLIFPYWQQGLLGTNDRAGPNYELAKQFLKGQSVTQFEQAQNNYDAAAAAKTPVGAVYCTFDNNIQVCGRSEKAGPPDRIMTLTEADYRSAIETAGDSKYPYVQGRAGNRTASGATALAAVTAAAPLQFAAYTGVFAGRLLLRLFVFAGLICGLALFLFPKLLRRMLNTVGSALFTILLLSAVGSLMSFLTLQLIANPTVFGTIGQTGGLVILAVISILIWLGVRPLHRIGAMLSTAAFNNPNALTNARRTVTGLGRRGTTMWMMRRLIRRGRYRGGYADHADPGSRHDTRHEPGEDTATAPGIRDARRPRPEGAVAIAGTRAAAGHSTARAGRPRNTAGDGRYRPEVADTAPVPATSTRAEQPTTQLPRPGGHTDSWDTAPTDMAGTPRWSDTHARSWDDDHGRPWTRPSADPAPRTDADTVDADRDPRWFSPRPAPQTPTGAFVISDVARQDIFRPAPDPGPRRRFTTSPPARHEITGTPQRPALPPATAEDDPAGRPETARAAAAVGGTR